MVAFPRQFGQPTIVFRVVIIYHAFMGSCFSCGTQIEKPETVFRATVCDECGADLRVCLNCEFYEKGVHWDCRETIPEEVREKERANFCDYFRVSTDDRDTGVSKRSRDRGTARDAFGNLFGDG